MAGESAQFASVSDSEPSSGFERLIVLLEPQWIRELAPGVPEKHRFSGTEIRG